MDVDGLPELDAGELSRLMADGDTSAVEVVTVLLRRIEAVDQGDEGVRAVLEVNPEATADARRADAERARGTVRSPLHGVPVLVKDNIDTAAPMHTTAGSWALHGTQPYVDAPVVRALREAGAVILGKTNLSEWANYRSTHSTSGWSAVGGLTRNPHDRARSAGGSSSGSAAAVAALLAPLSVGTETDGSIICPAAFCGVVGVKPTVGLVPTAGVVPIAHSQDSVGPMARTVRDAAYALAVLAGVAPDTYTAALPERGGRPITGIRIGVPRPQLWTEDADVAALTEAALSVLAGAGATIVDGVRMASLESFDPADELVVLDHELKADLAAYLATRPPGGPRTLADVIAFNREHAEVELAHFDQDTFERADLTTGLASADYVAARARCVDAARTHGLDAALAKHELDAMVMPSPGPAWRIDLVNGDAAAQRGAAGDEPSAVDSEPLGATSLPAMAGYPAVTVPSGAVRGLPVGLMITGGAWTESLLLRIAAGYEHRAVSGRS